VQYVAYTRCNFPYPSE